MNSIALDELLREVNTGSEGLQKMFSEMAEEAGIVPPDFDPVPSEEQPRLDEKSKITCPKCGHEFTN